MLVPRKQSSLSPTRDMSVDRASALNANPGNVTSDRIPAHRGQTDMRPIGTGLD